MHQLLPRMRRDRHVQRLVGSFALLLLQSMRRGGGESDTSTTYIISRTATATGSGLLNLSVFILYSDSSQNSTMRCPTSTTWCSPICASHSAFSSPSSPTSTACPAAANATRSRCSAAHSMAGTTNLLRTSSRRLQAPV
uniref:Uncharacterized protein n=1 Tax=Mantoniella antarctica TaxID=81844 RepID=A0A7S0SJ35_9CHLO